MAKLSTTDLTHKSPLKAARRFYDPRQPVSVCCKSEVENTLFPYCLTTATGKGGWGRTLGTESYPFVSAFLCMNRTCLSIREKFRSPTPLSLLFLFSLFDISLFILDCDSCVLVSSVIFLVLLF